MRLTICVKLAWRDLRETPRTSLALFSVIALCVAATTTVRMTSDGFLRTLGNIERAGLAGDFSVELRESPQPAQFDALRKTGAKWTLIISTIFPARSKQAADPIWIVIKTVDPRLYPFYGQFRLTPAGPLARALAGRSAIVSRALLREFGLRVGQSFSLNGLDCRIAGLIDEEPDRFAGSFAGPLRAIVSQKTLEETGVLRSSTPVLYRFAVSNPDRRRLSEMRLSLSEIFPEGTVFDPDSASPGLDAASTVSTFVTLLAWFALALGAAGIVVATHLHVHSRLETLATLKCLGSSNTVAFWWLALELFFLGAGGGITGCGVGLLVRRPLLSLAGIGTTSRLQHLAVPLAEAILMGIALPVVLGFCFVIPAIQQRPATLLRHETAYTSGPARIPWASVLTWLAICVAGGLLVANGGGFPVQLYPVLAVALLAVFSLFRTAFGLIQRAVANRPLAELPLTLRHTTRNLLSMESNHGIVTAIAAFIVMLIILAGVGETMAVQNVTRSLPVSQESLYVMGFSQTQLAGIRSILDGNPEIRQDEMRSFAWFRVGPATESDSPSAARSLPLFRVACSTALPAGSGMELDAAVARRFGVRPGSRIKLFRSDGGALNEVVHTILGTASADGVWSSITIPCADVEPQEIFYYAGLRMPDREIPALTRELNSSYPAVPTIRPHEFFAEVTNVIGTAAVIVRFTALFTIAAGLVVVAALMAASARRRAHQVAILRALGASQRITLRILICELAVLGSLAGLLGGVAGILAMDVVLSVLLNRRVLDLHPSALGLAIGTGIVSSLIAGWLSSAGILRRPPLITLRGE
jgi:putative ABC transport system permease protein